MRVVTMLPSATEIAYALGVEPVAVSHECDHPPAAAEKPSVERSRIDPTDDGATVHEQVQAAAAGDGVYEIDRETLREADPDLVVTQGVCDVCAVSEVQVERVVDDLGLDCEVLTTDPHLLCDVFGDIGRIGAALGREDRASELVGRLRERVEAVERAVHGRGRPRVVTFDWLDPLMVSGHWVPDLVRRAGGEFGLVAAGERSTTWEWEAVREYDPEVVVAAPCGFGLDRTMEEVEHLFDRSGYADMTATREGRAYAMDGNHYLNRPGPRLVDTLEYLAALLHPTVDALDEPPSDAVRPLPAPPVEPR